MRFVRARWGREGQFRAGPSVVPHGDRIGGYLCGARGGWGELPAGPRCGSTGPFTAEHLRHGREGGEMGGEKARTATSGRDVSGERCENGIGRARIAAVRHRGERE